MHRISNTVLYYESIVNILAAKQFLFHLAKQRRSDSHVIGIISHRLVETLRNNRELPRRVDNTSGTLLNKKDVVRSAAVWARRTSKGTKRKRATRAKPISGIED